MSDVPEKCQWCDEAIATTECDTCVAKLCEVCLEEHQHCIDCGGTGEREWNIMRDRQGLQDYQHGTPTGEVGREPCNRCEQTGLRL